MRQWIKVLCVVLVLLAALLAGLYWWQRENLKAVKDAVSHTSEELEEKLAENQQAIQEVVNAAPEITVRDLTEEERQALRDGTMTQEELVERLVDPNGESSQQTVSGVEEQPQTPEVPPAAPAEQPKPVEDAYQKELSAIIAKVYVLREEYTITLDNMYADAKAEYIAMPKEKRTKSNLMKMARGYITKATNLETECDRKMLSVADDMEKLIKANNGDLSLVDTVLNTYANEKSLKKSWYMSKLQEKGLV